MKINELISRLMELRYCYPDATVEVRNGAGNFNEIGELRIINHRQIEKKEWKIILLDV